MGRVSLAALRRLSQVICLALFVFLLVRTEFRGSFSASAGDIKLPYPVSIFLEADPLVAISNAVATGSLYKGLLWCLVIVIPTLFLGRFFCGWICPLGTLNHWFGSLKSENKRGKQLIESNRYKRWQNWKYYILIALIAAALFGEALVGIMDPISLTVRSLGLSILPGAGYAVNGALDALYQTGPRPIKLLADGLSFLFNELFLSLRQPHFRQGFFLGLLFLTILALNLRVTRLWCRAVCPLGALLGIFSRWSILGLKKQRTQCNDCNRCLLHCQGGDDPIPGARWRQPECHLCFNCVNDCPEAGIKFTFFPGAGAVDIPDLGRRNAIVSLGVGAAALPLFRSTAGRGVEDDPRLVRPPGAVDEKSFRRRCIRCGQCMKVCPNSALQPALLEAGLEGIWTPVLAPRIGYCETSCVLCGQVCPTGAIWEFTAKDKGWAAAGAGGNAKPIRIGTAFFDHGRCLPWSMATECIVCEEWCPTSPKAIYLRTTEAVDSKGQSKQIRQPYVDAELCVGCGACEYSCPVRDRPAIYVTSIGESRSKSNQILLRPSRKGPPK